MALSYIARQLIIKRTDYLLHARRTGYIVLVPEIGEDTSEKNPLIGENSLPEFNSITIENCMGAIGTQTLQFEAGIKSVEETIKQIQSSADDTKTTPDGFDNVFNALEDNRTTLDTTWGLAKTLYLGNRSLMPTKYYLTIHDKAKRTRASKFNSPIIYNYCKEQLNTGNKTEEQKRLLQKFIVEGKLNGLDVISDKKEQLKLVLNKLKTEREKFKDNVETSTRKFSQTIKELSVMRDFPEPLLKAMSLNESQSLVGPWKVTLQPQISIPFLEHCPNRELRWNVWQALVQRASGYADKSLENSTHIEIIRSLRKDQAQILGYENFIEMSMETKMAGGIKNAQKILDTLLERAKIAQEKEMTSLAQFAAERGFESDLQLWDLPYWKRKQRKTLYDYSDEVLKEYFPFPKVLQGLYELSEKLFNIRIKERSNTKTWHKDVKFYDIYEAHSSEPIGGFYLDPYSRSDEKIRTKEDNWMVGIRNHSYVTETKPLSALIFNFEAPSSTKPSLLSFQDVTNLFFRFGNGLLHLLSRNVYGEVAGLSNVEWDAVDVCGHVMSHWLYNPEVLRSISSHYQSEDPLPNQLIENLSRMRTHMSGSILCEKLYLSRLDFEIYTSTDFWLDIVKKLWPNYFLLPYDKKNSHLCSFAEIFSGEWPGAYYSHIWSQMIAADVYSAFHEARNEQDVIEVGKRFRDTFLALGGGCHPGEVFRRFRGRDPSPKALLATLGLKLKALTDK